MPLLDMVSPSPVTETGDSPDPQFDPIAAAREKIRKSRGYSPKRKSAPVADAPEPENENDRISELFQSENWEEIAALYPNIRFAMTGYEGFLLDDKERKILGTTLATSAKMLLAIDPRYVAIILTVANFGGIILKKEMVYRKYVELQRRKGTPPA